MNNIFGVILVAIVFVRSILAAFRLWTSYVFLSKSGSNKEIATRSSYPGVLLLIPVLGEQSIIIKTLEHFIKIKYPNFKLVVVGTQKELKDKNSLTTIEVVDQWKASQKVDIQNSFFTTTSADKKGNRATQLNHAVRWFQDHSDFVFEIIGVYDCDSLPDLNTLIFVAKEFKKGTRCLQQPLHYLDAAKSLSVQKRSPICVANAIYQGSWSLTKELPNLLGYHTHTRESRPFIYPESLYLNGHGQFLAKTLYDDIKGFPEGVVTDGIQLGYRLSLIEEPIASIPVFCSDDVPMHASQIIDQHKRWFAGNIQYLEAKDWAKNKQKKVLSYIPSVENLLLNIIWAFRLPFIIFLYIYIMIFMDGGLKIAAAILLTFSILLYCYVLPFLSVKIARRNLSFRFIDWAVLPVAAGMKSIGPLIYLLSVFTQGAKKAKSNLKKVER